MQTYKALDWFAIVTLVSDHCTLRASQSLLLENWNSFSMAQNAQEANRRYEIVRELWQMHDEGDSVPVGAVIDCRAQLALLQQGATLDESEWHQVAMSVDSLRLLYHWLQNHFDRYVMLAGEMPEFIDPGIVNLLVDSFDDLGELSESKYPILGNLRQKIQSVRDGIQEETKRLLQDADIGRQLQEQYITERQGRVVLPLKNSYNRKIGVAHGTSRSGETVYVEPWSLVKLSNVLQETQSQLEQQIREILRQLGVIVRPHIPSIMNAFQGAVRIDIRRACAQVGQQWKGTIPKVEDKGIVLLKNMRHPLLIASGKVVGNDFQLTQKQPAIIFSGPNAGGKTIALKSIGVAALLVHMGVPIPANDGARVDFFEQIFADVGDAQTVMEGLSSFSAHLLYMKSILAQSDANSLVLLDEIGMGTDPAQGSALAQAILEQLLESGSKLVITTHFTRLKALASVDSRFAVAALKLVNGQPTHQLQWGEVGESEALALAQRIDMGEVLLWRARNLLSQQERQIADLVQKLESQKAELDVQKQELKSQLKDLANQKSLFEQRNRKLEEGMHQIKEQAKKEFDRELKEKVSKANQILQELQNSPDMKSARRNMEALKDIRQSMKPVAAPPKSSISGDVNIKVGDHVELISLGCVSEVIKVLKGTKFEVNVDGLSMVVDQSDIAEIRKNAPKKKKKSESKSVFQGVDMSHATPSQYVMRSSFNTCDLRGYRVEDAFITLESYFDKQILSGRHTVFILHGHGTGALRTGVRDWLSSCSYVQKWRPASQQEGGDAYTVVFL